LNHSVAILAQSSLPLARRTCSLLAMVVKMVATVLPSTTTGAAIAADRLDVVAKLEETMSRGTAQAPDRRLLRWRRPYSGQQYRCSTRRSCHLHDEDLEARMGAIAPVLGEQIQAAREERLPQVSGGARAKRNVAVHTGFGMGPQVVAGSDLDLKRWQRGRRSKKQAFGEGSAADMEAMQEVFDEVTDGDVGVGGPSEAEHGCAKYRCLADLGNKAADDAGKDEFGGETDFFAR
jgi:hypothetical protein